jgi:hypothetical protein
MIEQEDHGREFQSEGSRARPSDEEEVRERLCHRLPVQRSTSLSSASVASFLYFRRVRVTESAKAFRLGRT